MARKIFKCGRCGRAFSMKAHLVRHVNVKHRVGSQKPIKSMSIKALRFAAARNPHAIDQRSASNGSLARIAVEMQAYRNRLFAEREQIGQRIAGLDSAMQAIGGSAAPKSSGRKSTQGVRSSGGRPGSLKAFISNVLRSRARPIGPHEIAQAVRTAGYKTKAKDLTNAVGNALAEMKSVKRVGYGLYRA